MVGGLGLLTGWTLLMPALLFVYVSLGFSYFRWVSVFLGITGSFPMLALMSVAGLIIQVRTLTQRID